MKNLIDANAFYYSKDLTKLVRQCRDFFIIWNNYGIEFYDNLSIEFNKRKFESAENPVIAAFLAETIEAIDGIRALYDNHCIEAAYPLVRKIFELYLHIVYIMHSDSQEKSIAYSAYYNSRKLQGSDDTRDIYTKMPSYAKYKKIADEAYSDNKFYEWYRIYDNKMISLLKISKMLGCEDVYSKIYNTFSKKSHGLFARDQLKFLTADHRAHIQYKAPDGILHQILACQYSIGRIYKSVTDHYQYGEDELYDILKKQSDNVDSIRKKFESWESNEEK